MTSQSEYVSLESSCLGIKAKNPALLLAIADRLRSIIDPLSEFHPETIYVKDERDPDRGLTITYLDVSKYFNAATGKFVPVLFEMNDKFVESHKVMVSREWLDGQVIAADQALGKIEPAQVEMAGSGQVLKLANASFIINYEDQPTPLDSNSYGHLHRNLALQGDQRKAQNAASKDAIARREAERKLAIAEALLNEARSKEKVTAEENRSLFNELSAKNRKIQDQEIAINDLNERLAVFESCFDPSNPIHPFKLNEAFECWKAVTKDGSFDPSGPGGRGAKVLVMEWLRLQGESDIGDIKNTSAKVKRLAVIIGWRGQGSGAIRSR